MNQEHAQKAEEFCKHAVHLARKGRKDLGGPVSAESALDVGAAALKGVKILQLRIVELQTRIEELERQPFAYDGPHEAGKTYRKGTFVTHGGGLWHCNHTTASNPGDGPAWTLAVKRGKDAR